MQDHDLGGGLARLVREQLAAGHDIDDVLWTLRQATDGALIQAIAAVWKALGVPLRDAIALVETSPAFCANHEAHQEYRAELRVWLTPAIEAARCTR